MGTLLLSRSEVRRLLDPAALVPAMGDAFRSYSLEREVPRRRVRPPLPGGGEGGAMVLVPGIPAYTVKVHAKFPGRNPAIRGVLHGAGSPVSRPRSSSSSAEISAATPSHNAGVQPGQSSALGSPTRRT